MFGLPSISKLVVLLGLIAAVIYGYRLIGRMQADRVAARKAAAREATQYASGNPASGPKAQAEAQAGAKALELVCCPSCSAYFPKGTVCDCKQ